MTGGAFILAGSYLATFAAGCVFMLAVLLFVVWRGGKANR